MRLCCRLRRPLRREGREAHRPDLDGSALPDRRPSRHAGGPLLHLRAVQRPLATASTATTPRTTSAKRIATNGNYVLFALIGHAGEDLGTLHPTVLNVATGHKQAYNTSAEDFSTLKLTALAVNAQGAAAWVYEQFPLDAGEGIQQREVQKGDANGFAVLDQGLGINPASLTLNGTSLTWTDGGQQRSATLTP